MEYQNMFVFVATFISIAATQWSQIVDGAVAPPIGPIAPAHHSHRSHHHSHAPAPSSLGGAGAPAPLSLETAGAPLPPLDIPGAPLPPLDIPGAPALLPGSTGAPAGNGANNESSVCQNLMLDMISCLSFVSTGSVATEPDEPCCNGLQSVLLANAKCVCEAFKDNGPIEFDVDVERAKALPAACHIQNAPPPTLCDDPSSSAAADGGKGQAGGPAAATQGSNEVEHPSSSSSMTIMGRYYITVAFLYLLVNTLA